MRAFCTMLKTEIKISFRGIDMIIFAVIMPVVIIVLLGIIFSGKPAFDGAEYSFLEQSFGAVASISICAAGVMGLPIVVTDYRHKKILKRFKVTPVSPAIILAVQMVVNFIYVVISLISTFLVAMLFFDFRLRGDILPFIGAYLLVVVSMFSIGLLVGGVSPNVKISNLLCSVLYFPMLIFSGATLPYEIMPSALQKISDIMPLTQGIKLLKSTSLGLPAGNVTVPIVVMVLTAVICIGISIRFFRWE